MLELLETLRDDSAPHDDCRAGIPAVPVATYGVPLTPETTMKEFSRRLKPLARGVPFANKVRETRAAESASPAATL